MQRASFTKVISIILCGFLLIYFGVNLVQSARNPLRTAPAITMQSEDSFFAPGVLIRDETVINVRYPVVAALVREGERVSVGMAYLVSYASEADREREMRRGQLEQEIAGLELRLAADGGLHTTASVEAEIRQGIRDLGFAARQGDLGQLEDQTIALRTLALAGDREGLARRLETLESELETLFGAAAAANVTPIVADRAGVYSARLDGYESLSPADLERFDVEIVREILERRVSPPQHGAGKLIAGSVWYYAAIVPEAEAGHLAERLVGSLPNRVTVIFSELAGVEIPMRIHSLGVPQDGYRLAVFSANTALTETMGLRQTEARIVYDTFTGIRVPHEALHRGEPNAETGIAPAYVFTLTVGTAEQRFVTVLFEGPDYYLVRPDMSRSTDAGALRDGNTIIVRARDLYDGRVFR